MKLHLGCGQRKLEGYVHIDMNKYDHIDYVHNIGNLPMINSESVDQIYCSNAFEYFDREQGREVLREWRRVLKVGGELYLSVPNLESIVNIYNGDADDRGILGPLFGRWEANDGIIYHKTVYDYKSLHRALKITGYYEVSSYDWREFLPDGYDDYSKAYIPHMDTSGIHMALNIKAVR